MYRRVHWTRYIGLWFGLLVIHAVTGGSFKCDEVKTYYETQTKPSNIFSIFSIVYYIKNIQTISQINNQLAGSATENVTKLSLASMRMQVVERSQLCKLLSSDDFNRQRGVVMSIIVMISAIAVPYVGR